MNSNSPYHLAQRALADLKEAVRAVLEESGRDGVTNAQIGRQLGIYAGHQGHEGHVSRVLLAMLESEGVASQDETTLRWCLKHNDSNGSEK